MEPVDRQVEVRVAAAEDDHALAALDRLAEALARLAEDHSELARRVDELRHARRGGGGWRELLGAEEAPGSMQLLSRMLARLSEASGEVRRELVGGLRREGATIPAVARLFGVTHQRVSNLLRRGDR
jgi:hypothetical protein